jgi:hypothetical protein
MPSQGPENTLTEAIESLNTPRFPARLDSWLYRILREIDFTSSAAQGFSVRTPAAVRLADHHRPCRPPKFDRRSVREVATFG